MSHPDRSRRTSRPGWHQPGEDGAHPLDVLLLLRDAVRVHGGAEIENRQIDPIKPRIRAVTGFITIDAKSYASPIQETVTFLSQVRDAVQGGGIRRRGPRAGEMTEFSGALANAIIQPLPGSSRR